MNNWKDEAIKLAQAGELSWRKISEVIGKPKSTVSDYLRSALSPYSDKVSQQNRKQHLKMPKMLVLDVETSPILGSVWSLWQQNVGLNMIVHDWFLLAYAAKWYGVPAEETMYNDLRGCVKEEDDSLLLVELWELLDEADIIITQNGKKFDAKKINARFIMNGFTPPSSYKHIDTLQIAKSKFGFTSNKLEYMTDKLCTKYKKMTHGKFPGFLLWKECLAENPEAWNEMKVYNIHDVLSLEELFSKMRAWDGKRPNMNLYSDDEANICCCGSHNVVEYGYVFTQVSKFQRYKCKDCGTETRGRKNLFSKEKLASIKIPI